MSRIVAFLTYILLVVPTASVAVTSAPESLEDLYLGETLYYGFQDRWFDAISSLDSELQQYRQLDEPELDTLYPHIGLAEFAVGDFELAYRMHQRAGRAITAVINGQVSAEVRNEALYRLAKIQFQKGQHRNAQLALDRISGPIPADLQSDLAFLRAQVAMANGRFEAAVDILQQLEKEHSYPGFAEYNLGIALLGSGDTEAGWNKLNQTGQLNIDGRLELAIRDKANLALGDNLLASDHPEAAKRTFDRVRLEGPFSNRALLGAGWAEAVREHYDQALVPWSILADREITDAAVQESLMAVPYAYGKLGVHSRAAVLYGRALELFGAEIDKLSKSISSIREGRFLAALTRPEFMQGSDWVVRVRDLPGSPETYYLLDLMASHDFQTLLKNYLDLEDLRRRLEGWQTDLDAYDELIEKRRAYYQPLLPNIDNAFRQLDGQMKLRLEQRGQIEKRMQAMLTAPRPEFLITARERTIRNRLNTLESYSVNHTDMPAAVADRIKRLHGVLDWTLKTEYDRRQTVTFKHLQDLNADIELLQQRYETFVRTRQAVTQSYQGYSQTIIAHRTRIARASETVDRLGKRIGHQLEQMAVAELQKRRTRLEEFQVKARFAMADSYDRAVRQEADQEEEQ